MPCYQSSNSIKSLTYIQSLAIPRSINWDLGGNGDQKAGMKALFDACSQRYGAMLNKEVTSASAGGSARREGSNSAGTRRPAKATREARPRAGAFPQGTTRGEPITCDLTESQSLDLPVSAVTAGVVQHVPVTPAAVNPFSESGQANGAGSGSSDSAPSLSRQ